MAISLQNAIQQNTLSYSEGTPLGVPSGFAWYNGVFKAAAAAPADFTSVTAWGQVYQDSGEPASASAAANVQVANSKTYVHLKSTGEWLLVQDQANTPIAGGHYNADFAGQSAINMPVSTSGDGTATFAGPPNGYNDHFWPAARGTFAANDVDAVYVQMDMRVTDPNVNLIGQIGADWWRNSTAPFVQGFSNNPTAGAGNWIDLSTDWKTLAFSSSNAVLEADPPPGLVGGPVESPPAPQPTMLTTVEAQPTTTTTVEAQPTTTTTVEQPPSRDNLVVNGSSDAAAVPKSEWADFNSSAGSAAINGGTVELWNSLNGVGATGGKSFGESSVATVGGASVASSMGFQNTHQQSFGPTLTPAGLNQSPAFMRQNFGAAPGADSVASGTAFQNVQQQSLAPAFTNAGLDRSLTLMTQYSAATPGGASVASSMASQTAHQESVAPTLTQAHQLG